MSRAPGDAGSLAASGAHGVPVPQPVPPAAAGHTDAGTPARWLFADAEFDEAAGQLAVAGEPVEIEPRPLRLLGELLRRADDVVARDELLDTVWFDRVTTDHVLASAVSKLRAALGPLAGERIVTVPRVGYRLLGPVQRAQAPTRARGLVAGEPVPGRDGWLLETLLGSSADAPVWRARHARLGHTHVFKFALHAARLSALQREYTLYRVLHRELGPRDDIAQVLSANFEHAPCFLECADGGQHLLDWSLEAGRLAAMPLDDRLALFVQIAAAVAAAHSVGVLHKDLKPRNVIVAAVPGAPARWRARLTDFGSGQLTDPGRLAALQLTALGMTQAQGAVSDARSGTYLYMAPECLAGARPTVQSDVFALGVLLYQLLAGDLQKPLNTGWQRDIADTLLCEDIAAATEGAPAQRLPSVAALVERLSTRAARSEQRAAQQAQAQEQQRLAAAARLAAARRPWIVVAGMVLVAALGVSTWQQRVAARAQQAAEAAAREAVAVRDFLALDVLSSADVTRAGASRPTTLNDVLQRAAKGAAGRFREQPLLEAALRRQLARAFQRLGNTGDTKRQADAARALYAAHLPPDDPRALSQRFERVVQALEIPKARENNPGIFDEYAEALRLAGSAAGRATGNAAAMADELGYWALQAQLAVLTHRDQPAQALAAAKALVALADRLPQPALDERVASRRLLAQLLIRQGAMEAAEAVLAELASPELGAADASRVVYASQRWYIAADHRSAGRWRDAERVLDDIARTLAGAAQPSALHLGYNAQEYGHLFKQEGDFARAARWYGQAIASFTAALGDNHQFVHITGKNQGDALTEEGRHAEAAAVYMRHRPWFLENATGGRWMPLEWALARALVGAGQAPQALALARSWQPSKAEAPATRALEDAYAHIALGLAQVATGHRAEGEAAFRAGMAGVEAAELPGWVAANLRRDLARLR